MSAHQVLDHVDQYLQLGRDYDCSDLHLPTAYPPAWRRFGQLSPIWDDHHPLTAADTERLARSFLDEKEWERLQKQGDIDFAYSAPNGRYRASVVKQRLGYDMAFRIINDKIKSIEEIGLPLETFCRSLAIKTALSWSPELWVPVSPPLSRPSSTS